MHATGYTTAEVDDKRQISTPEISLPVNRDFRVSSMHSHFSWFPPIGFVLDFQLI